jgi:hypothetical protein
MFTPAEKLAHEISREGIESWADFEMKLGEYSLKFADRSFGRKDDYLSAYEAFISHLHNELMQEYTRFSKDGFVASIAQNV